ncbi:MAG TPA: cyclopropane-fatty-acyl-phospholipid synthase family protein [Burkholderiales bacterium]|nr:cyclopropane-fatty-acyl-phospholipid synthase family protein [Burkholderiales bacterium]
MLQDWILKRVEARLKRDCLPIAIRLWNGAIVNEIASPRVTLALNSPATLRLFVKPDLSALVESYLKQDIDVHGDINDVVRLLTPFFRGATDQVRRWRDLLRIFGHSRAHDSKAVRYHYDVSNDFYALWLDRRLVYSCAYFQAPTDSIDLAQEQKLVHICKKLLLRPGERLLDVGCGWGGLIFWAAEHFDVYCEGVTVSEQQYAFVKEQVIARRLSGRVRVHLQDYRDIPEDKPFDKVVSVGMFEHVGVRLLPAYFQKIFRLLKPGGVVMNHGITTESFDGKRASTGGDFIERYIFPGGELTHISKVLELMARQGFEVLDVESLRRHYAQTLWHWVNNLEANQQTARRLVGEEKYRSWRAYLGGFAYAFEQRWDNIYQILAVKPFADGRIGYPMTRQHVYG